MLFTLKDQLLHSELNGSNLIEIVCVQPCQLNHKVTYDRSHMHALVCVLPVFINHVCKVVTPLKIT